MQRKQHWQSSMNYPGFVVSSTVLRRSPRPDASLCAGRSWWVSGQHVESCAATHCRTPSYSTRPWRSSVVMKRQRPQSSRRQPHRSLSIVSRAAHLSQRGDFSRARRMLEDVVTASPHDTRAWLALAKTETRAGKTNRATLVLERACATNPRCVHLVHALGRLQEDKGAYELARQHYKTCIDIRKDDGLAWQSLAILSEREGRIEDARRLFHEGSENAPRSAHLWSAWGVLEHRTGNHDRACELLERAYSLDPKHTRTLQAWAIAEEKRGRYVDAKKLFRQALREDPQSVPTLQAYALMEARRGELDTARELFQEGLGVDPSHAAILHAWATMEARAGNFEMARDIFDRGVSAAPESTAMLRAWASMELELGHIDKSTGWTVPPGTGRNSGFARRARSGKRRNPKLLAVGENLRMLRRLVERRSDEDLKTVMKWIEGRAKAERDLAEKVASRGESDLRRVLEWTERRGEADVSAFKDFLEDRYERDRLIAVYLFNLDIPPLPKSMNPTVPSDITQNADKAEGYSRPPPVPQEWYVLDERPSSGLDDFDRELHESGYNALTEKIAGIEFLGEISERLATRTAVTLALGSLSLLLVGCFAYFDAKGYTTTPEDVFFPELPPPTGVDARLTQYTPEEIE